MKISNSGILNLFDGFICVIAMKIELLILDTMLIPFALDTLALLLVIKQTHNTKVQIAAFSAPTIQTAHYTADCSNTIRIKKKSA